MEATLGTSAYSAGNCIGSSDGSTGYVISGLGGGTTTPAFPYVSIEIANWTNATGTFNFDSTGTANYAEYITNDSTAKICKSGSIAITSVSTTAVSGIFNFTCTDGLVVSGGVFNARKD
jgi:hypothetical protein